jgi:hypothetical protein
MKVVRRKASLLSGGATVELAEGSQGSKATTTTMRVAIAREGKDERE